MNTNRARPTLIATIGPAGAGKTTWRNRHAPPGATVVSLDEHRAALSPCGCSGNQAVNDAAVATGTAVTRSRLAAGGTVVWDVTSYLPRFRAQLLDLAAEYDATTVGLVVCPPLLTVLARNGRRDPRSCPECGHARRVPDPVVWEMHQAITAALPRLHTEGWQTLHFLDLPPYLRPHHHRTPRARPLSLTTKDGTMRLNSTARETLRDFGISQAEWARRNHFADGRWHGDACGCPDDRCIGYHHDDPDDCGCLPALLAEGGDR